MSSSTIHQQLLHNLANAFKVQGKDKKGRKILQIIGKFFPGRALDEAGGEEAIRSYLESNIFPKLAGETFVVVYFHSYVTRSENFPGISALRSLYEAVPISIRNGIHAVYFVHPGLQSRLFFATLGRFLFSAGLYGKLRYVSRLGYLNGYIRRGEIEVPEFVHDHDEELEQQPLMDYGIEGRNLQEVYYDGAAMDSTASMRALRCIS